MTTCEKCGGFLWEEGDMVSDSDGAGHKPGCPDGIACIHGSLKRACNECENAARIAELARHLADAGQQYAALYNAKRRAEEELSQEKDRNATLERQLAEAHEDADRRDRITSDAIVAALS